MRLNNKYKQLFIIVGIISILIICYSQQKELTKLRANNLENQHIINSLTLASKQKDSLINRYHWATNLMFVEICQDQYGKFDTLFNSDYQLLEIQATGGY